MGAPECIEFMQMGEYLFANDEGFQKEMAALVAGEGDSVAFSEAMARRLPDEQAAALRAEFAELPFWLGRTIAEHWVIARNAGKHFSLRSVRPSDVTSAARNRRVELSVAVDADEVVLRLSHVATRHAKWYATEPAALAT